MELELWPLKVGVPPGGGWRAHGRGNDRTHGHSGVGYAFIHTAIDSYTRLAYSEVLPDEKATTAVAFWQRAHNWFGDPGIRIEIVQTDNGSSYRARAFTIAVEATGAHHRRLPPDAPPGTEKSSASTAPSSTNGLTCASTEPTSPAPKPSRGGCISTITTAPTLPSQADLKEYFPAVFEKEAAQPFNVLARRRVWNA